MIWAVIKTKTRKKVCWTGEKRGKKTSHGKSISLRMKTFFIDIVIERRNSCNKKRYRI